MVEFIIGISREEASGSFNKIPQITTPASGCSTLNLISFTSAYMYGKEFVAGSDETSNNYLNNIFVTLNFEPISGLNYNKYTSTSITFQGIAEQYITLAPKVTYRITGSLWNRNGSDSHINAPNIKIRLDGASVKKCTAPSSVKYGDYIQKLGGEVNIEWRDASSGGPYNPIIGYEVYYSPSENGAYTKIAEITETRNRGNYIFYPNSPQFVNGQKYYFRVKTIGTIPEYNSDLSSGLPGTGILKINTLPNKPVIRQIIYQGQSYTRVEDLPKLPNKGGSLSIEIYNQNAGEQKFDTVDLDGQEVSYVYNTEIINEKISLVRDSSTGMVNIMAYPSGDTHQAIYKLYTYDGLEYSAESTNISLSFNTPPSMVSMSILPATAPFQSIKNLSNHLYHKIFNFSSPIATTQSGNILRYKWMIQTSSSAKPEELIEGNSISSYNISSKVAFGDTYQLGCKAIDNYDDESIIKWDNNTYIIPLAPTLTGYNYWIDSPTPPSNWNYFYKQVRFDWTQDTGFTPELGTIKLVNPEGYQLRIGDNGKERIIYNEDGTGSIEIEILNREDGTNYFPLGINNIIFYISFSHSDDNHRKLYDDLFMRRPPATIIPQNISVNFGNLSSNRLRMYTNTSEIIKIAWLSQLEAGLNPNVQNPLFKYNIRIQTPTSNFNMSELIPTAESDLGTLNFTYNDLANRGYNGDFNILFTELLNKDYDTKLLVSRISPQEEYFTNSIDFYITFREPLSLTNWSYECVCLDKNNEIEVPVPPKHQLFKDQTFKFKVKVKSYNNETITIQPQIRRISQTDSNEANAGIELQKGVWEDYTFGSSIKLIPISTPIGFYNYEGETVITYKIPEILQDSYCDFRLIYSTSETRYNREILATNDSWYKPRKSHNANLGLIKTVYNGREVLEDAPITDPDSPPWTTDLIISDIGSSNFYQLSNNINKNIQLSFEYSDVDFTGISPTIAMMRINKTIDRNNMIDQGDGTKLPEEINYNNQQTIYVNYDKLPINKYITYKGFSEIGRDPENFLQNGSSLDIIYFRAKLVITNIYENIIYGGTTYTPTGNPQIISYSPYLIVLNKIPTICYRKNRLGINTNSFASEAAKNAVLNLRATTQYYNVVFSTTGSNKESIINLLDGSMVNFILDGGNWE